MYIYIYIYDNCPIFHRSMPSLIILHTFSQHSSVWVSSAYLKIAIESKERCPETIHFTTAHKNDFNVVPRDLSLLQSAFLWVRSAFLKRATELKASCPESIHFTGAHINDLLNKFSLVWFDSILIIVVI